jgi:glutamate--cysteine ligase
VLPQILALSRKGLAARGFSEEGFLAPLDAIAESGVTGAGRLRALFHDEWGGDIDRVYHTGITY